MEQIGSRSRRIIKIFIALYVVALAVRPIPGYPTYNLSLYILSLIAVAWTLSVRERILETATRRLLMSIGLLLLALHVTQMCKYDFFTDIDIVARHLWYAYYIPLIAIPMLSLCVSSRIGLHPDKGMDLRLIPLIIFCAILMILTMTNDLHQLMFSFNEGFADWRSDYDRGILFLIVNLWIYLMMVLSLALAVRRSMHTSSRKQSWIPFMTLVICLIMLIAFFIRDGGVTRPIFGYSFLTFPYIYNLMFILFWESCIKIGLLPSNTDYGVVLNISSIRARITKKNGDSVYSSPNALPLTDELKSVVPPLAVVLDDDTKLYCSEIGGGKLYWEEDISAITKINEELRRIYETLQGENLLIVQENKLIQDRASLDMTNRLYDEIAEALRPELVKIQTLLNSAKTLPDEGFKKALSEATIYGAYVKRKANLMLMGRNGQTVRLKELELAISESLEYAAGLGIRSAVNLKGDRDSSADAVIEAYDRFEKTLEEHLNEVTDVMAVINGDTSVMKLAIDPGELSEEVSL